jgi:putative transposase
LCQGCAVGSQKTDFESRIIADPTSFTGILGDFEGSFGYPISRDGWSFWKLSKCLDGVTNWFTICLKLRSDAALYEPFTGKYCGSGPRPKYGDKVDVRKMKKKYLKSDKKEDGIRTQIYQALLINKGFAFSLNVVVILKTNLAAHKQAHVILFSTDLKLPHEKLFDYYTLRFQIEFNFRDAKQYWGLDNFMNVKEEAVTNAANLSFFMVNFSSVLLRRYQENNPEFSVLDLKSHYRGCRYASETIKLLPQKPDGILLAEIFEQIARLGMVHPAFEPVSTS